MAEKHAQFVLYSRREKYEALGHSTVADKDNIQRIYLSVRGKLARAIMGIVPPRDVEDIVQETYVRVCQVGKTKQIRTPRSFLFKIAKNLALDHVKSAEYRLSTSSDAIEDGENLGAAIGSDETFNQASTDEEFARFCEAVRQLSTQCRRAFVLKKVYGFSQREIAEEMGISENTVEKHIAKGIRQCDSYMQQYNFGAIGCAESQCLTNKHGHETDQ